MYHRPTRRGPRTVARDFTTDVRDFFRHDTFFVNIGLCIVLFLIAGVIFS